ncbi:phosphonoacetaldehyde reductase [Oribacterium sinus]|uniref:Alcohol dehydrogenase, iron-dependent n=1 Tax=Oribacterium sinus F0268 TaxID=585501 RepID=C2KU47_9FIRM|nr:phosphonoacetaldehyde reductase [Oribacterium sinus]EEJ52701.1 alcohol dehydrogenase, iron-dependent [Oribacterium sinus F0268]
MTGEEIENQIVLGKKNLREELNSFFQGYSFKRVFLVAGKSFSKLPIGKEIEEIFSDLGISSYHFSAFQANPRLEEVEAGIDAYSAFQGDSILAVGGGSALDTAKCIKLFAGLSKEQSYLEQEFRENDIPLLVHPTTAGTGSESTPFAVIYKGGEKCSVEHESIYPKYRIEDARSLRSLPLYQKKVTLLDALSHAMEAIWSKYSNEDSRAYGQKAISLILTNYKAYLSLENKNDAKVQGKASSAEDPSQSVLESIAEAANLAGKAIAVTKTTAGHALSYKLGSLYQLPHGLATAMVNRALYPFMCREKSRMIHPENLLFLAKCFLAETEEEGAKRYLEILEDLEIIPTLSVKAGDLENLVAAVNPERLSNHPIALREEDIRLLYKEILGGK